MRKPVFQLSAFLLLLSGGAVHAQSEPPSPEPEVRAVAFIVPQPVEGERDLSFQSLLFAALRIELERAGLEVRLMRDERLASLAGSELPSLLEAAREADADFLFREGYIINEQELRIDIVVYRVEEGERAASVKTAGRIGLRMDEPVTRAAQALMPQLEASIASALERRRKTLAGKPPVEAVPAERAQPAEEPAGDLRTSTPMKPEAPETPPSIERVRRPPTWQVEVGAASFFPMLALSEVFDLGFEGTFTLERFWNTSVGTVSLGLYTGYIFLKAVDAERAAYFRTLVPTGLALRWAFLQGSRLGLFLRFLGGAAVNVSEQSKVRGRLTRVLPQLEAGAGMTLAFSARLGISVGFLYEMLFYLYMVDGKAAGDLILWLSAPSICVYTRW